MAHACSLITFVPSYWHVWTDAVDWYSLLVVQRHHRLGHASDMPAKRGIYYLKLDIFADPAVLLRDGNILH